MSNWTEDRVERAKDLWIKGNSARDIAVMMGGGLTRNAVLGKMARLGLVGDPTLYRPTLSPSAAPRRATVRQAAAAPTRRKARVDAAPVAAPAPVTPPRPVRMPQARPLPPLGAHACRWPIGDPRDETFAFCGSRAVTAKPYCPEHCRKAYVPVGPVKL